MKRYVAEEAGASGNAAGMFAIRSILALFK